MSDMSPDEKRKDLQKQLNNLFAGMNKSVQVPADKSVSPIEEKLKKVMKEIPNPLAMGQPQISTEPEVKPELIVVEGHIVPKDLNFLISFVLAKLAEKDPDIEALLKQFEFEFSDENGKTIYPKNK